MGKQLIPIQKLPFIDQMIYWQDLAEILRRIDRFTPGAIKNWSKTISLRDENSILPLLLVAFGHSIYAPPQVEILTTPPLNIAEDCGIQITNMFCKFTCREVSATEHRTSNCKRTTCQLSLSRVVCMRCFLSRCHAQNNMLSTRLTHVFVPRSVA